MHEKQVELFRALEVTEVEARAQHSTQSPSLSYTYSSYA